MIKARRLLSTTTPEDLSRYSDFFTVFNVQHNYRNSLNQDEMSLLEREERAILSLRK